MQFQENVSLKSYNTFGIDVSAKFFMSFFSIDELHTLFGNQQIDNNKLLLLGGGSNILFTKNFEGLVLKNELKGIFLVNEDENYFYVKAAAGESWNGFVMYCLENNYAGVENLSLIPGCIGASPMQNIGAYGVEVKDVFFELEAFHIHEKKIVKFSLNDCEFGYRESVFKRKYKNQFIILNVVFRLPKKIVFNISYEAISQELEKMNVKELSIRSISQSIINIRRSKLPDPKVTGNAGSFFKNPTVLLEKLKELKNEFPFIPNYDVQDTNTINHETTINSQLKKIAAGWLIEQCGWKGYRDGDAGCNPMQALVLVNYGNAKGEEIFALSEKIIQSVQLKFGINLEREVNII